MIAADAPRIFQYALCKNAHLFHRDFFAARVKRWHRCINFLKKIGIITGAVLRRHIFPDGGDFKLIRKAGHQDGAALLQEGIDDTRNSSLQWGAKRFHGSMNADICAANPKRVDGMNQILCIQ